MKFFIVRTETCLSPEILIRLRKEGRFRDGFLLCGCGKCRRARAQVSPSPQARFLDVDADQVVGSVGTFHSHAKDLPVEKKFWRQDRWERKRALRAFEERQREQQQEFEWKTNRHSSSRRR